MAAACGQPIDAYGARGYAVLSLRYSLGSPLRTDSVTLPPAVDARSYVLDLID